MTSPIEQMLYQAILDFVPPVACLLDCTTDGRKYTLTTVNKRIDVLTEPPYGVDDEFDSAHSYGDGPADITLYRNVHMLTYRVDFLVEAGGKWLVVECDGHDYHNTTKQQVAYDRARDREVQRLGLNVFRFTGSDIFHSAERCAAEVYDMAVSMLAATRAAESELNEAYNAANDAGFEAGKIEGFAEGQQAGVRELIGLQRAAGDLAPRQANFLTGMRLSNGFVPSELG